MGPAGSEDRSISHGREGSRIGPDFLEMKNMKKRNRRPKAARGGDTTVLALREREAAEAIGVSVKTLRNWRYMTPIKGPRPSRIGRVIVYPIAEIERCINEHIVR